MNTNEFIRNSTNLPPEYLSPFLEQHVAWSEDGQEILAHASDLDSLFNEIDRKGLTHYVIGFIPNCDLSDLGGATK